MRSHFNSQECFQSGRISVRILEITGGNVSNDLFISVCQFGFRKWKSHVTERPIEDRSDVVKELYSELNYVKQLSGQKKKTLNPIR